MVVSTKSEVFIKGNSLERYCEVNLNITNNYEPFALKLKPFEARLISDVINSWHHGQV